MKQLKDNSVFRYARFDAEHCYVVFNFSSPRKCLIFQTNSVKLPLPKRLARDKDLYQLRLNTKYPIHWRSIDTNFHHKSNNSNKMIYLDYAKSYEFDKPLETEKKSYFKKKKHYQQIQKKIVKKRQNIQPTTCRIHN